LKDATKEYQKAIHLAKLQRKWWHRKTKARYARKELKATSTSAGIDGAKLNDGEDEEKKRKREICRSHGAYKTYGTQVHHDEKERLNDSTSKQKA